MNSMEDRIPNISFSLRNRSKIGFDIFSLEKLIARKEKLDHSIDKPHRIDFYILLYITKGEGVHYVDFQSHPCSEGSIVLISREQVHSFDISSGLEGYVILFTDEFLSNNLIHSELKTLSGLYNYHFFSPVFHPDSVEGRVLGNIVAEMFREYYMPENSARVEILRLLLKLLLLKSDRIKQTVIPDDMNVEWLAVFNRFRNDLNENYSRTRNAAEYAGMLDISYKHLNTVCKAVTGNTVKGFIDMFIVLEAKRRLAVSDISVKELSYELGFDEPTNFLKFFKKFTCQTPVQFRKILTK